MTPGSWETVELGNVATLQRGFDLPKRDRSKGDYPLISSSGAIDTHEEGPVEGPGVVTGRSGSIGSIFYVEQDFWPLNTVLFVKDFHGNDPRFVYYLLQSLDLERFAGGTGVPTLNRNIVHKERVLLPPLSEQRRLVVLLDAAFAGLATATAHTQQNLQNARELFETHLVQTFSRTESGWGHHSLGDHIDLLSGFAFKSRGYTDSSDSIRLLRGDNIMQGYLRWERAKRWPIVERAEYTRYELKEGDVVLAMDRTWVQAGIKYAVIGAVDLPCLLVQRVARIRPVSIDRRFLAHLLGSQLFTNYVLSIQTGLGVPHISGQQISDFTYQAPLLKQQQAIGEQLDALHEQVGQLIEEYNCKLAALDELKQSILHRAFRGELSGDRPVPQLSKIHG